MADQNIGLTRAGMYIRTVDGRWIPFDGTISTSNTEYLQLLNADDLVTTINYTDSTKETVSTVVMTSAVLGITSTETFVSGITTLTITRVES